MAKNTSSSTNVAKKNRALNAVKKGVFSNSLLAHEDPQLVEEVVIDLLDRFEVEDSSGEIMVRRFVQTALQTKRLNQAQIDYVEGYMQSEGMRQEFCRQAGILILESSCLPSWFFTDEDNDFMKASLFLNDVVQEAEDLLKNYSVELMNRVKLEYPNLWEYLMGEEGSATQKVYTFGDRLGKLYQKTSAHENLRVLVQHIEQKHKYDLLWAENENRYKLIVRGLKAKSIMDSMSNANWARIDGLLHRRTQDVLQTLVSLQHEKKLLNQQHLEVVSTLESESKLLDKSRQTDVEVKVN